MSSSFKNKRVLVTGAGRGIGRAIVKELVSKEASVIALSKTKANLDNLKKEFPSIEIVAVDVGNWKETEAAVQKLGAIDMLVNNAGIITLQEVGSITEDEVDECFSVNVKAVANISQIVAVNMKKAGIRGSIVNLSSQASMVGIPKHATYCASKGAVDQLTKVFALELGPSGIRVNSVNPTVILTDMGKRACGSGSLEEKKAAIPLGEFPEPEDVVKAVLFLLSEDSRMITGAHLPIDGGYTCH
ncbi:L-xylulose reductase [Parasteatoda tepidariorum]|uniref:L-xylulose reductase n=1 Tax=Parasteatoda tepidariorum TaxID=114398 RepID=UPI00077F9B79|nr:L-xylulose reductase [Parasteatoda tepidariorum]